MLMWVERNAADGTQEDINAWANFESGARQAKVLIIGAALQTAAKAAKLVVTELSKPGKRAGISNGTFSSTQAQIEAFYILECTTEDEAIVWAKKLPTRGTVEVRPCLDYDLSQYMVERMS